ncbi:DEKNAAC100915 [Brettanomyces naardenensis]|uniref:Kinetochore protein NDC80 n=1 Tax=Brettanomyces naardenensis TaxID=13370 RepID=A0A448YGY5_BRENA|nr:DEKNAAC100915 [Brettanomyces naardenensis]
MTPSSQQRLFLERQNRDPRPIRDRNFQAKMQRDLFEYLSNQKFDIEMKQQLTARTMKSPTQKEFVLIFQFLYKKLDPGYRFVRSVEQDIYSILKFVEYPYLDNINKSQLSAVGGTNWPNFLAMLHWLLQLVIGMQAFDNMNLNNMPKEDQNGGGLGSNNNSVVFTKNIEDSVILRENTMLDRLFTSFALKSYKSYLMTGADDYSAYFAEMEREYGNCTQDIVEKTERLAEENDRLASELDDKAAEHKELHSKVERTRALETDVSKFQRYVDLQRQRSKKWPSILEKAKKDIESIKESIKEAEVEKDRIINDLKDKGFTLKDIEQMHKERAQLSSTFDSVEEKQRQISNFIEERHSTLKQSYEAFEGLLKTYNAGVYSILDTVKLPDIPKLTVTSFSDDLVNDESKLGLKPDEMVPELEQLNVKAQLGELKEAVQKSHLHNRDECIQLQENLDDLKLKSVSLKDQLEELEDRLAKSKKDYSELNEQKTAEVAADQDQLEKCSNDTRQMASQLEEDRKQLEEEFSSAQAEVKRLTTELSEQRNELLIELANGMGYAVSFKTGVMGDLEGCNEALVGELTERTSGTS